MHTHSSSITSDQSMNVMRAEQLETKMFPAVMVMLCTWLLILNTPREVCRSNPIPDVWLNVPAMKIDRLSLTGENTTTRVRLSAQVASGMLLHAEFVVYLGRINLSISGEIFIDADLIGRFSLDMNAQVQLSMYLDPVDREQLIYPILDQRERFFSTVCVDFHLICR